MKIVKAVEPFIHTDGINFKLVPYEAWKATPLPVAKGLYPWRWLHGLVYRAEFPNIKWLRGLFGLKDEARLMFVEPVSIKFDTFPYYATHEVIPMIWDLWPHNYERMKAWFKKHKTRTAIISSRTASEYMKEQFPDMNILFCPEAVDTTQYGEGKELTDRSIDVLEFGRSKGLTFDSSSGIKHVCTKVGGKFIYTDDQLKEAMQDAKITVCFPHSMTNPQNSGGLETLTQRYWEAMLSRMVIVGHAPQELVDICGYNPVIEVPYHDDELIVNRISDILSNIADYMEMVDRNRETALKLGDWGIRMIAIKKWLYKQ